MTARVSLIFSLLFCLLPNVVFAVDKPLTEKWTAYQQWYETDDKHGYVKSGIAPLNYFDGEKYNDIAQLGQQFAFPEGALMNLKESKLFRVVDKPSWGEFKIDDKNNVVQLVDKAGNVIFQYTDPRIGAVTDEKLINTESQSWLLGENTLYLQVSPDTEFSGIVKVYDDVLSMSLQESGWGFSEQSTTIGKIWSASQIACGYATTTLPSKGFHNSFFRFTTPTSSPLTYTITTSSINFYTTTAINTSSGYSYEIWTITNTAWVGSQASYKNYKTGSAWTTPGGDFDVMVASFITTTTWPTSWRRFDFSNTLAWQTQYNIGCKLSTSTPPLNEQYIYFRSDQFSDANVRPYILINYVRTDFWTSNRLTHFLTRYQKTLVYVLSAILGLAILKIFIDLTRTIWSWYNRIIR